MRTFPFCASERISSAVYFARRLLPICQRSLERGATLEKMMDGALRYLHALGEIVLNQLVKNDRQPQVIGDALR